MEEKKLVWLVEAEGRGITPTSWRWELKGTVEVVVDRLRSKNRIMSEATENPRADSDSAEAMFSMS
jgi:hypothetical protein